MEGEGGAVEEEGEGRGGGGDSEQRRHKEIARRLGNSIPLRKLLYIHLVFSIIVHAGIYTYHWRCVMYVLSRIILLKDFFKTTPPFRALYYV